MSALSQNATLLEIFPLSKKVYCLRFSIKTHVQAIPGQYYAIRVTSKEGYIAERIYSVANNANEKNIVEFGVELIQNGELSPYLCSLKTGDVIEIKGPSGEMFNWDESTNNPVVLIAGGTGIVPYLSMLRTFYSKKQSADRSITLLCSFKTKEDILYYEELKVLQEKYKHFQLHITLTRTIPEDWNGFTKRITAEMISQVSPKEHRENTQYYVCGSSSFVESMRHIFERNTLSKTPVKFEYFG